MNVNDMVKMAGMEKAFKADIKRIEEELRRLNHLIKENMCSMESAWYKIHKIEQEEQVDGACGAELKLSHGAAILTPNTKRCGRSFAHKGPHLAGNLEWSWV